VFYKLPISLIITQFQLLIPP